jgi:hypothetical protein
VLKRFRSSLSYANVVATLALFAAVGTGGAYAANTIGSADVIDESLQSVDIKDGEVKNSDIRNNAITSLKINNGSVLNAEIGNNAVTTGKIADGAVGTADIANDAVDGAKVAGDSITNSELATDSVQASEIADNSIDAGEIVDFGLSNEDVGVLFAQVNGDGSIFNSSGGVTGSSLGTGTYNVDFGRNISNCAAVATQGEGGVGGAGGAIMGVTDRSGNPNAVFATARTNAGALVNTAFQLVIVC